MNDSELIELPVDVLNDIVLFLGVSELPQLALLCRSFAALTRSERASEGLARQLFPEVTLRLQAYHPHTSKTDDNECSSDEKKSRIGNNEKNRQHSIQSFPKNLLLPFLNKVTTSPRRCVRTSHPPCGPWRQLLRDGNSENGIKVRRIEGVLSKWQNNGFHLFGGRQQLFYLNSIRKIAWDEREGSIHLVLDAYGMEDLRPAHSTAIYRNGQRVATQKHRYLLQETGHSVCELTFRQEDFFKEHGNREYVYEYVFNGPLRTASRYRCSDYPCVTFLRTRAGPCHRFFSLAKDNDVTTTMEARPLGYRKATDGILKWIDLHFEIPEQIKELHESGLWGGTPAD